MELTWHGAAWHGADATWAGVAWTDVAWAGVAWAGVSFRLFFIVKSVHMPCQGIPGGSFLKPESPFLKVYGLVFTSFEFFYKGL